MNKIVSDTEIDVIYNYVNDMITKNEWHDLSMLFWNFLPQINEMPLDIILAYATASLPGKNRIKYRRRFLDLCEEMYPDNELWRGL